MLLRMAGAVSFVLRSWLFTTLLLVALSNISYGQSLTTGCKTPVKKCNTKRDYFPSKIELSFIKDQIKELKYFNTFVDFTVQVSGSAAIFKYRVVKCGCSSANPGDRQVIFTNPKAVYVNDGSLLGLLEGLVPSLSPLKYVFSAGNIFSTKAQSRITKGKIEELGKDGGLNFETITNDPAFGVSFISAFAAQGFEDANTGKPYLVIPEVNEETPLGRCEWIKIFELVFDNSEVATKKFNKILRSYERVKKTAAKAIRRPSLFFNSPFGANWFQPSEKQFVTQFARDANADYHFQDDESSTTNSLDFQEILTNFKSARYLVNAGFFPTSSETKLEDFINAPIDATDGLPYKDLVRQLDSVRCGNVWSNQRRVREDNFASDYFESAVFRPDLLLADYARLLHPELKIRGNFVYLYSYGKASVKLVGSKCPYKTLTGLPPRGRVFVDRYYVLTSLDRFQAEDLVEEEVLLGLRGVSDLSKTTMEVFFTNAFTETDVSFTVRVLVPKRDASKIRKSKSILPALRSALGSSVKEISTKEYLKRLEAQRKNQSS